MKILPFIQQYFSIKTEHINVLEDKNNEITKLKAQISEYNIKEKEFRNLSAKKEGEIDDLKYKLLLLKEKNKLKEKIEQSKDEDNKKKQNDLEKLIKEKYEEILKLKEIIEKLKKEIDFLKDILKQKENEKRNLKNIKISINKK